jgi:hypothetical protein
LIASNITKIVDVIKTGCTSIKTLHKYLMLVEPHYIEQTPPTIYASVNELEFHCIYWLTNTWESFIYIEKFMQQAYKTIVYMHE